MNCEHRNLRVKADTYQTGLDKTILEMFVVCIQCEMHFHVTNMPKELLIIKSDQHAFSTIRTRS